MILVVALPLAVIAAAMFGLGWAGTRLAGRLDGLPGSCQWCGTRPLSARGMTALPSDCTCKQPCPVTACGARAVKKETDLA